MERDYAQIVICGRSNTMANMTNYTTLRLVDTIEAMRKHIEALQQENEQLQAECDGKERYTIELFNRTKEAEDEVEWSCGTTFAWL